LEKNNARGMATSQLHFPPCPPECYGHWKIHPEYSISYDRSVGPNDKTIHIGARVISNPTIAKKLPTHYHEF
jgi:hypothetical protein